MVSSETPSARYVWYVISLLALVNVFNYMDRMALSVLLPSIKADLDLSDKQLGLLMGFAFFLFYALCGIPIARWADRGVRRSIIALALASWSVMTAITGAAQNFWQLFVARVGVGVGEAGCLPPGQSMICDYVPLRRRPGIFALHHFGLVAGMMMGLALAGWLDKTIGWRWTFVVLGIPGIALAIVVRFTLREPKRGAFDTIVRQQGSLTLFETLKVIWRCKTYRMLLSFFVVNGFIQMGLTQWLPSFYVRTFGLAMPIVGAYLGLAIGIGSGAGLLIGGVLANGAGQRDARITLWISAAAVCLVLPAVLGALFVSSPMVSIVLISVAVLCWSVLVGPATAALYSVTAPQVRATAGAINIFVTSVLGFGLGPLCVGLLSDILTPTLGAEALRYALAIPLTFIPLTVIALCMAAQRLPGDLIATGAQA